MNSDKQIQLYLEGNLKGKDLQDFKQRLKDDDAFRKLVLNYQKAWNLIDKQYRKMSSKDQLKERSRNSKNAISPEEIKEQFSEFLSETDANALDEEKLRQVLDSVMKRPARNIRKIGFILVMAAGLILLIGLPVAFYKSNETKNSSLLYDRYFSPYPYLLHERSIPDSDSSIGKKAMFFYNRHEYESAALLLEKIKKDSITNPLINLYLGVCYMEEEKYPDAIRIFENLITKRQELTYTQARWFLGLSYLKLNKRGKAGEQLIILKADSGLYTKQAREILNSLKQN